MLRLNAPGQTYNEQMLAIPRHMYVARPYKG